MCRGHILHSRSQGKGTNNNPIYFTDLNHVHIINIRDADDWVSRKIFFNNASNFPSLECTFNDFASTKRPFGYRNQNSKHSVSFFLLLFSVNYSRNTWRGGIKSGKKLFETKWTWDLFSVFRSNWKRTEIEPKWEFVRQIFCKSTSRKIITGHCDRLKIARS